MSNYMVPFDAPQLPAHLQQFAGVVSADDLTAGATGGFPVISIKGKVFHIVRGDEVTLVTKPEAPDEPAAAIEVVILKANPALSKNFYKTGYVEGSTDKPTCYSPDGIEPAADVQERQSVKCATCVHNQWGSKVTEQGSKGKACADTRRLAIAPANQLNDVMLLRVPAASLRPLSDYGDMLKKRGVQYPTVVTKIGFDYTVAHPLLTFKPVSFLNETQLKQVRDVLSGELPTQITGQLQKAALLQHPTAAQSTAPAHAGVGQGAVAAPAPIAAPQEASTTPPPSPPVGAPAAAATIKSTKAKKTVAMGGATPTPSRPAPTVQMSSELEADLARILSNAGFDDAAKQ